MNPPRALAALVSLALSAQALLAAGCSGSPDTVLFNGKIFALWALSLTFPPHELESMLRDSIKYDDQLILHVSGTPAARAMLDAMEHTGGAATWRNRRVRFEHGDGILADVIPRLKALGVIVVQNPTHLDLVDLRSHNKLDTSQPLRSLLAAGIPVALGSEGPLNPHLNIRLASTHPDRPSEALTREEAVTAYTVTSAYAEFAEREKGSLEAGKLADLVVLSQDIFAVSSEQLPRTASVFTMVGGRVVHDTYVLGGCETGKATGDDSIIEVNIRPRCIRSGRSLMAGGEISERLKEHAEKRDHEMARVSESQLCRQALPFSCPFETAKTGRP
jgi:hypothetical protein